MKEVYINITTDGNGKLVDEESQKVLTQYPNNQVSPLLMNANGRRWIRCLLLSSGRGLAMAIND